MEKMKANAGYFGNDFHQLRAHRLSGRKLPARTRVSILADIRSALPGRDFHVRIADVD